jgi:integrase/recombinase XerD
MCRSRQNVIRDHEKAPISHRTHCHAICTCLSAIPATVGLDTSAANDDTLFVIQGDPRRRLRQRALIKDTFALYRRRADMTKPVSPHILRHTMATTMLFNGCPIGHSKELLGHERLDTTCRYYLGLDRRAVRAAHAQFLSYD